MFSVIIPLYNKENHIQKAIESVLKQTFQSFELIVINDGSTDQSLSNISSISDKRILVLNQKNAGVSSARNHGAKKARNPYLVFLDADDWWDIRYLEELKNIIGKFPNAGIYCTRFFVVKNGIFHKSNIKLGPNFKSGFINYFETYNKTFNQLIFPSNACIPKHIFNFYKGFNPSITHGEDFHLWVKIAIQHPVVCLNKSLSFYNQDVDPCNQASKNLPDIKKSYIYYFYEFAEAEKDNIELKVLLDHIRIGVCFRYKNHNLFTKEVREITKQVDFSEQKKIYRIMYSLPILPFKLLFKIHNWKIKISKRLKNLF